jgi:uncharacterized YccA/Bax inhibitor family protein
MESRNPVFSNNKAFSQNGYAGFDTRGGGTGAQATAATASAQDLQDMYAAPSATPLQTGRMTIDDVVMRTATIFAVLLTTAAATFFVVQPRSFALILGAGLVGFGLAMWISFSKTIRPALILAYAAVEGVFVGGISYVYADIFGPGIVPQAILGTLGAFTAMLLLYRSGKVRATPKFTRTLLIAGAGYLVFALVNLGISLFTGSSAYNTPFGWLIAAFGVGLASFFLILDFDTIEKGIRNGAPQQFAWVAAFGLVVTLVWLYLEILRLLAILRGDN